MPRLQPNGKAIYHHFSAVEQNRGFSAVFKPGEFVAPKTYVPEPWPRSDKPSEVDGNPDWIKFRCPKPEGLNIRAIYYDTFPKLYKEMNQAGVLNVRGAPKCYGSRHYPKRNILPNLDGKKATISWWSAKPEDEDIEDRQNNTCESLCTGPAFDNIKSKVKNSNGDLASERITCNLWHVINAYKKSVGVGTVQLRTLGTFRYIREVMHAVLVCPADVPTVDFDSFPIIEHEEGEPFEWKPYCTDNGYGRMWDHLSFAFYLKEGDTISIPAIMYSHERLKCNIKKNGWMY